MPKLRSKKEINMNEVEVDTKNPTIVKEQKAARKKERARKSKARKIRNFIIILISILLVTVVGLYIYFYTTDSFKIENVEINGVEHLTDDEMNQLASVPEDTTLLKVDTDIIAKRLKRDAWIQDVNIILAFPNTLVINVKEREVTAIVEVPTSDSQTSKRN